MAELELLDDDGWTRGLAIVAHPDDLEYGAASAIARWTSEGKRFAYVLVTSGEAGLAIPPEEAGPLREAEQRASAAAVGVDDVAFLGYPDGVVEYGLPLRRDLAREIRRHRPEVVVSINRHDSWGGPSFNMADHRNVGLAVLDAVRDAANPWIFRDLDEVAWDGVRMVLFGNDPDGKHAVDVTGFLDRGVESLRQHAAYLEHVGTDPDAMLRQWAEDAGRRAGVEHAVVFELLQP